MSKLSQAKRTAEETAWDLWHPEGPNPGRRAIHQHGFIAGRDYGRERERALEEALRSIAGHPKGDAPMGAEAAQRIARNALAASQPKVLGERSDTEPGELEGRPTNDEMMRQAERVDEVYGRRSQMEIYRLYPGVDETEGIATWSGPTVLDSTEPPLLCVPYAQFSEALDALRACSTQSQTADDFVFRMDVNHVRSAVQPDHGPGEPRDQAVVEAASILRKIALNRDPREHKPEPVPLDVRIEAESWLAAHLPPVMQAGESNG